MEFEVLSSISCSGTKYAIGDRIPLEGLSDRDIKELTKLGCIRTTARTAVSSSFPGEAEDTSPGETPGARDVRSAINTSGSDSRDADPSTTDRTEASEILSGTMTNPKKILEYVNNADAAGLERIKGIGAATAKAMIAHGKFESLKLLKELVPAIAWDKIEIKN